MTPSRHRPARNPAAQQSPALLRCATLSVGSTRGINMRRREFITLLGGAAALCPLGASAQQVRKIRTIGYLSPGVPVFTAVTTAFSNGLLELGWIEGQNIAIERRYAENRLERLPELAAELVRLNVE